MSRAGEFRKILMGLVLGLGIGVMPGCAPTPVEPNPGALPATETVYVIAAAWHTEIGISTNDVAEPLARLAAGSPSARYLVFGWGSRDYYMASHPSLGDALAAITPGPAVMLVIPLTASLSQTFGKNTKTYPIPVSREGIARLSAFLWGYLVKDRDGMFHPIEQGPYPGSAFYAAGGTYSLARTCNTFTVDALQAAGVPVNTAGVFLASQVTDQLAAIAR